MRKVEIRAIIVSFIAVVFNILIIPGYGVLTVFSFLFLSITYMFFSFALFNNVRFRKLFKKESYKGVSFYRIIGAIGVGLSLSLLTVGILFKLQRWEGSIVLLLTGLLFLLLIMVIAIIKYSKPASAFYMLIFRRMAIFGLLGFILMIIPEKKLTAFKFRNHPAYLKALKKYDANPGSKELRKKAHDLKP